MSRLLNSVAAFLGCLPTSAFARRTGVLFLPQIDKASFGFSILFAVLALVQLGISAITLAMQRHPVKDYRGRRPFTIFMILAIVWLLIDYILSAIVFSQNGEFSTINLQPGAYYVLGFATMASPVFIYAGLVFLLFQRSEAGKSAGGYPPKNGALGALLLAFGSLFAFIMLAAAIAFAALQANIYDPYGYVRQNIVNVNIAIYRLYIAAYVILTFAIAAAALMFWLQRDSLGTNPALTRFDNNVIFPILSIISPLLIARALFELAAEIATADPTFFRKINEPKLSLASVIIEGFTQLIVIFVALFLGY